MRVTGSFSGSCRRAAAGPLAATVMARQSDAVISDSRRILLRLFPVLDLEFRLLFTLPVVDLELQVFRPDALLELERCTALVVAVVRALAAEERHQLVLAHLEVAEIQPVHTPLEQGFDFPW